MNGAAVERVHCFAEVHVKLADGAKKRKLNNYENFIYR
jgi:hypothetical protein